MLRLANAELSIELLDPVDDRERLGPRFCGGGFIWQVHDAHAGPLLAGPEWPNPVPSPFNAQGLPESFRHSTTTGEPLLWAGETGLAPGAGALRRDATGAVFVSEPCRWSIRDSDKCLLFSTAQNVDRWSYELERTIALRNRTIVSTSRLANSGTTTVMLEWFAHPFFPLLNGRTRVIVPAGTQLAQNPGFVLTGNELTFYRPFAGEHDGHLDHLTLPRDQPLAATLSHPAIHYVRFSTDFAPFKCVIWANGNTLSLEPFLRLHLAPGESREWSLSYEFGTAFSP